MHTGDHTTSERREGNSFQGGVFSELETGGRSSAVLTLGDSRLVARTPKGREYVWNFDALELEQGGSSGRMVFCRGGSSAATAFSDQKGFLEALERASGGLLEGRIEVVRDSTRQRRRSSLRTGLVLLGIFAAFLGLLFWGLSVGSRWAVDSLPISVDQQLGDLASPLIEQEGEEIDDPVLVEPVRAIVALLEPQAALEGFDYDVHVVQSDQVNAFALPGGTIVVLTGLLAEAESPEEVAGVLAHEISHVTLRHGLKRIARSAGALVALRLFLGNGDGLLGTAAGMANQATMLGHSREQEGEADLEGARMLCAAGINPKGLADFFALLQTQATDVPEIPTWFSTHPDHEARVEAIQARIGELGDKDYSSLAKRLSVDWDNVRRTAELLQESE